MKLQPEEHECVNFVHLIALQRKALLPLLIHNANQRKVSPGKKGGATQGLLRRMGFQPGLPDYLLAVPRVIVANDGTLRRAALGGLWLEMKAPGGRLDDLQAETLARFVSGGYACCVTWNAYAAVAAVNRYLTDDRPEAWEHVLGFPAAEPGFRVDAPAFELDLLTKTGTLRRRAEGVVAG